MSAKKTRPAGNNERPPSRTERREEKRRRERERIAKHGAGLRRVYRDAILKRARESVPKSGSRPGRPRGFRFLDTHDARGIITHAS